MVIWTESIDGVSHQTMIYKEVDPDVVPHLFGHAEQLKAEGRIKYKAISISWSLFYDGKRVYRHAFGDTERVYHDALNLFYQNNPNTL